jgi:hypothetical protein
MLKRCSKCQMTKSLTNFGKNKLATDGYHYWCRTCAAASSARTRHKNRKVASGRRYYPGDTAVVAAGHSFCSGCQTAKPVSAFGRNARRKSGLTWYCRVCAKRLAARSWSKTRAARYGLTLEQLDAIRQRNNGLCEICGIRAGSQLDHDHITGFVRGFLCRQCNTSLGQFGDTLTGVQRAVSYLEHAHNNPIGAGASPTKKRKRVKFKKN